MQEVIKELEKHYYLKNDALTFRNKFLKTRIGRLGWFLAQNPEKPLMISGAVCILIMFALTAILGSGSFVANVSVISYLISLPIISSIGIFTYKYEPMNPSFKKEISLKMLEISQRYPKAKSIVKKYAQELEKDLPYIWWHETNKILLKFKQKEDMSYKDIKEILLKNESVSEGVEIKKHEAFDLI